MKIVVFKCRFTGKIFEQENRHKYIKHLKSLREEMRQERAYKKIRAEWEAWLLEEKKKIHCVADIPKWIIDNQRKIMDACNAIIFSTDFEARNRFVENDRLEKLVWENSRYNVSCSNTHSCPHNGVTNWGGYKPEAPRGYPGWEGYLGGSLKRPRAKNSSYPISELLNFIGVKTGTGGGANEHFGYGFTIFLDDWPGLYEEVRQMEEDQIVKKLKGQK